MAELTEAQRKLAERDAATGKAPQQAQTTALAVATPGRIERIQTKDPTEAYNALQRYMQDHNCNVLMPTDVTDALSPYYCTSISVLKLDVSEAGGDVYGHPKTENGRTSKVDFLKAGELALAKNGILKLADAGGIIWDMKLCMRTDDRKRPDYCEFQAVGGIRRADGTMHWVKKTRATDLEVIRSGRDKPEYNKVGTISASERQFIVPSTETKAMLSVVRTLFKIKQKYTQEELAKVFVVPKMVFAPDYSDPMVRQWMMAAGSGAQVALYGGPQQALPAAEAADAHIAAMQGETSAPTAGPGDVMSEPADKAELEDIGGDGIEDAEHTIEEDPPQPKTAPQPEQKAEPKSKPAPPEPPAPDAALVELQQQMLGAIQGAQDFKALQALGREFTKQKDRLGDLWHPIVDLYREREEAFRKPA